MNELHRCDGRNGLSCAEDGGRGVCLSDVHHLVQKPVSVAQMQFTHVTRSPRERQIAGIVVCGSKIDIVAGISARDSVAMEKSFLQLVFEVLCVATATLVQPLGCHPPHTRCTLLRANHTHRSETALCFCFFRRSIVMARSSLTVDFLKSAGRDDTRHLVQFFPK